MKRIVLLALVLLVSLAAVGLAGCYRRELPASQQIHFGNGESAGPTRSYEPTVALGGARELDAIVRMGAGELALEAGGADALDATFDYRPDSLKPTVSYEVAGTGVPVGRLLVQQPEFQPNMLGSGKNSWIVGLCTTVPLTLDVELGAGTSDLSFGGLDLRTLTMSMGAGDSTLDFSGEWNHDVSARIQAGVGQLTLRLPEAVGVRVVQRGGIGAFTADDGFTSQDGAFVNRAYGETTSTIEISVQRGIGEVTLETVR